MYSLTILERMILESLSKSKKSVLELIYDIDLEIELIQNAIEELKQRNLVKASKGIVEINIEELTKWNQSEHIKDSLREEIKEILEASIDTYFANPENSMVRIKKVNMSSDEKKIFNAMISNLDNFIKGLTESKKNQSVKDQEVIFWGFSGYRNLAEQIMA